MSTSFSSSLSSAASSRYGYVSFCTEKKKKKKSPYLLVGTKEEAHATTNHLFIVAEGRQPAKVSQFMSQMQFVQLRLAS
jgi:hypothetical protein